MTIRRRSFISGGLTSLATLMLPNRAAAREESPTGYAYGVSTLNPENMQQELSSVVRLNLVNGEVTYHPLPDHRLGHSLMSLPDGGFFAVPYGDETTGCVYLDKNLEVQDILAAPDGYGFGGHATLLPDGKRIFGHFNRAGYAERKRSIEQTGRNFVVDIRSRKIEYQAETQIVLGHDIVLSRDGSQIFIGDDSTLQHRTPEEAMAAIDSPYSLINHAPSVVVYDAVSFAEQKTIPLGINGSLVHIEQDKAGAVFGAAEQYVGRNETGLIALRELLGEGGDIERYVDSLQSRGFDRELPFPGPLVRVNVSDGSMEKHLAPQNQSPFDIKLNEKTGSVFNVFTGSNMLARFDPGKQSWTYHSTAAFGIEQPYGLADIPGTTYMLVNGFMRGIAVFNTLTMEPVFSFPIENFGIKHLLYRA